MPEAHGLNPGAVTFLRNTAKESSVMDKNRVAGSIKEIEGVAKEAIGNAVGHAKLRSDGETDKAVGTI